MTRSGVGEGTTHDEGGTALANSASAEWHIFGLPNSIDAATGDDGWTVIPFGLWPHTAGYQRFGAEQAQAIVDAFKSGWGKIKRAICGAPVYKGHPDNPQMANQYPDKTVYGAISDMEARPDGLAIKQTLFPAGATLVANGLDRISPNWYVRDTGEKKNDRPIYEPVAIKSIGLVKKPNIPNLSLVNSQPEDIMKELLIKLLALANEATDEQIVAAVTELSKRPEGKSLDGLKNDLAVANGRVTTLTAELANEKARADKGAESLANAHKAEVAGLLANAIREGKIAAADKASWQTILDGNYEAGKIALANAKPALKTKPRVTSESLADADRRAREEFANGGDEANGEEGDGATMDGMANRGRKIQAMVNAEMAALRDGGCPSTGNSLRNRAWANVKKHMPSLFTDGAHNEDDDRAGLPDKPTKHKQGPTTKHADTTQA